MSSTLMWRPVSKTEGGLPYPLKRTLSKKLWGTDGSCGGGTAIVNEKLVPYLEGLRDAGVDGAGELIDLIREFGEVELWHQH